MPSNHLQRPFLAGKNGQAQNFLAVDHALNGSPAIAFGEQSVDVDQATDVVRVVLDWDRGSLPQFALREGQGVKLRLTAFEPLFEAGAWIGRHREEGQRWL